MLHVIMSVLVWQWTQEHYVILSIVVKFTVISNVLHKKDGVAIHRYKVDVFNMIFNSIQLISTSCINYNCTVACYWFCIWNERQTNKLPLKVKLSLHLPTHKMLKYRLSNKCSVRLCLRHAHMYLRIDQI